MATEYKLNYTASEINQKLATVDETKNTLENSYYNSLEIDGMLEQANSEVEASLATKADLVDGKVPIEQLPDDIGGGASDWNDIQNKPGDTVITSIDVSYDWSSYDNIDNQDNYRALMYMGCNVSTPRTIDVSLKNKTTEDITEFGSCELSSADLGGMELIQCSINTTTSTDGLIMGTETSLTKIDSSLPAVTIAFIPAQSMTMFATDIVDYTNYELIISCEDTASIKLSNSSLNLDEEPIEGSENYVNSGAVYTAFRDVYDFVNEQVGGNVVNSVNGKTDDVVLTAFDVGALPNTTEIPVIPTDISVFNNDVNYMTESNVENRLAEFSKYYITEDELEQELNEKQDNLIFDNVPKENSSNPITSKGVYEALKNVSASDWNDIQNKPGDTVTTIASEDVINIENLQDVVYEEDAGCYVWFTEYGSDEECDNRGNIIGKEAKISIRNPNDSESSIYTAEVFAMYEGEQDAVIYFNATSHNFEEWISSSLSKDNEALPAFALLFVDGIALYASEDLSGYDIRVFFEDVATYTVKLSNEALNFDSEPTENSENLVTSGRIYNLVNDINDAISKSASAFDYINSGIINLKPECTAIAPNAFKNNGNLDRVIIAPGVTSIGNSAFYNCSSLTSVTIGDSVTSIGDFAFWYCTSLTSVIIGDSVTSIGDCAFEYCSSLASVTIGDGVTTTGSSVFGCCTSLTSVTIGNSLTRIADNMFNGCTSLTNITIPDNVTAIGGYAFVGCTSLNDIYMHGTTPPTLEGANAIPTTTTIHVPVGSGDAYKSATNWSSYSNQIVEDITL